ncbi:non-ribosomal peptide synthetase [Pseudomonas sp. RHF3.3-3]|uniref:Amino acid adenylation enzyme/thioester reductase family protein n=1 Tax=Pseudomonas asplenii TaxID=53407 RepID=A0A0M9GG30_9PSED|nr:non-ribosomal peptide synthetase [Pseudomonas fuscovaginae]KPA90320.1 amino acid adenylation enzyme/thioester reductase family protein [Pseudomonas fuscovaginae]
MSCKLGQAGRTRSNSIHYLRDGVNASTSLTFAELDEAVREAAAFLQHGCDVRAGQHVMITLRDPLRFATAFLACQYIGAVPIGLSSNFKRFSVGDHLLAIARDAQARVLLVDAMQQQHGAIDVLRQYTDVSVVAIGERFECGFRAAARVDSPVAFVQYTSGSTRDPKGSVVSRKALEAQFDLLMRTFGFDEHSRFVNWLPLHHDMGLVSKLLLPYHLGATSVHMLPATFMQRPSRWLRVIDEFGGTVSSAPNFAYELCLHIPEHELQGIDLSSWSSAVCGAEAVRHDTLAKFATRFASHGFDSRSLCPAYGMAEATLMISARRGLAHDAPAQRGEQAAGESLATMGALASCGMPEDTDVDIRIVDTATRRECEPGQVGEIWVSAPSLAQGYLRNGQIDSDAFDHCLPQVPRRRYLATGDLGYIASSGIHVLGRIGSAITVAGRKYFFTDIEFAMLQLDSRFTPNSAAALSRDGGQTVTLVYQVRPSAIALDDLPVLGERCASRIEAMFPIAVAGVLFTHRSLPRTSSGKLQRDRVREMFEVEPLQGSYIMRAHRQSAPEPGAGAGPLETVAHLLGRAAHELDLERTLVELGADSLTIVRIQFEWERRFACVLDRARMYAGARLGDLLDEIHPSVPQVIAPPEPVSARSVAATHYQRALVFAQTLAGQPIYTLQRAVCIEGQIEPDRLRLVLARLEERHEALCGHFSLASGELSYVVDADCAPSLVFEDLGMQDATASARLHEWSVQGIEIDAARLYRVVLLRRREGGAFLLLQVHHAITDFWSFVIIWRDLFALYEAVSRDELVHKSPDAALYRHFCQEHQAYLGSQQAQNDAHYWQSKLNSACDPRLPLLAQGLERYEARRHRSELSKDLVAAIRVRAAEVGVTVGCVLQLAMEASLGILTRRERVRYGVALLNRAARYRDTVGMFANLIPMEAEVTANACIDDALLDVRNRLASALAHEAVPLSQLGTDLAASGSTSGTCFDVVFAYFDMAGLDVGAESVGIAFEREFASFDIGGLKVSPFQLPPAFVHYPMQIQLLGDDDHLQLCVDYRHDALDSLLVWSWVQQFHSALAVIAQGSNRRLSAAMALPATILCKLQAWGEEAGSPPPSTMARIVGQALAHPDAIALIPAGEGEVWTYGRLLVMADAYARQVRAHATDKRQVVVAVMLPRSPLGVAACLGVMLAGGIYLPIDPSTPVSRRDYMLSDSGAVAVIANSESLQAGLTLPLIATPDDTRDSLASSDSMNLFACANAGAYVLYTSGSTGQPKGVLVDHRALDHRLDWMIERLALSADDVFVQKTIWTFDVSLWEILAPLALGAKAVCIQPQHERYPEAVADAVLRNGVTIMHFVPSVLSHWLGIDGVRKAIAGLRHVVCSGEAMLPAHVQAFFACAPHVRLFNFYGPTEAGIDVTYAELFANSTEVSIGRPAPNCEVSIVDEQGVPVLPGAEGELVVAGPQVAIGYIGKPALTADRFIPPPLGRGSRSYRTGDRARFDEHGNIFYLGRLDGQVKLSGYRIELGEIEQTLSRLPGIRNVVVMLVEEVGPARLCAFVHIDHQVALTRIEIEAHARAWLPEFMVPREWRLLTEWPLLTNGKVDRAQLRAERRRDGADAPVVGATGLRDQLALHWQAVLGGPVPCDADDFFECGGDSILALHLIGRLREAGIALSVQALFRSSSFAGIQETLASSGNVQPAVPAVAPFSLLSEQERSVLETAEFEDAYPLSYLQRGIVYKFFNDDHYEVFVTTLELVARWDAPALHRALRHVVAEHGFLRTSVDLERFAEPVQILHRFVEVELAVEDLTEFTEAERQRQLKSWIEAEKKRPFTWEVAPHFRCTVHLLDQERFQLTFADASLDGWCVATVLTELLEVYSAYSMGKVPDTARRPLLGYAEFVALERQALTSAAHAQFWANVLETGCFADTQAPSLSAGGLHRRLTWQATARPVERLKAIAQVARVPLKNLLMAIHFYALARVTNSTLQRSGVEFNGRPELSGGDRCIGVFNNLLPVAIDLQGMSWGQLLRTCFDIEKSYLPYRRFPYARLVAMNDGRPLFQALFVYTHFHVYRGLQALPLKVASHYASDQTYVPLTVHFNQDHLGDGLRVLFDYDARHVSRDQVEQVRAAIATTFEFLSQYDSIKDMLGEAVFPGPALPAPLSLNVTLDEPYA